MDHQDVPQWIYCSGRAVCQVAGDLVPSESPDVRSLCIYTMWLFIFFLLERTLKQELHKCQLGPRGIRISCPPAPKDCPGCPPHPSSSPPSPPPSYHPPSSPPYSSLSPPISGGSEGLQALPPLLQGPVGQARGCLHTGHASSSPQVAK